jgi:demethylmenaquinone methyltransferase/2-methoxy-6-polyprenyl-1,4-benzoquinol methylase
MNSTSAGPTREEGLAGRHATIDGGSGEMFDAIAHRYDLINRIISLGLDRRWRRLTAGALHLESRARVLDIATGTADLAIAVARTSSQSEVWAIDPSAKMRELAEHKVAAAGLENRIHIRGGSAELLPFDDATFDAVSVGFGIRNFPDRMRALKEMKRVLAPRGRVAILEATEPERDILGRPARLYIHHIVPVIGAFIASAREYRYLEQSIARFPKPDVFMEMMRDAGFADVGCRALALGAASLFTGAVS